MFSPSSAPSETELQTVCAVAGIAQCLYRFISSASSRVSSTLLLPISVSMSRRQAIHADLSDNLSTLLGHMATYFPFAVFWPVASKRDVKVR